METNKIQLTAFPNDIPCASPLPFARFPATPIIKSTIRLAGKATVEISFVSGAMKNNTLESQPATRVPRNTPGRISSIIEHEKRNSGRSIWIFFNRWFWLDKLLYRRFSYTFERKLFEVRRWSIYANGVNHTGETDFSGENCLQVFAMPQ